MLIHGPASIMCTVHVLICKQRVSFSSSARSFGGVDETKKQAGGAEGSNTTYIVEELRSLVWNGISVFNTLS